MKDEHPFTPDWFSKPGDSLRSSMQRRGVSARELAAKLPTGMDEIRGILDGSRSVDESTAKILSVTVGGSADFWLKRQQNYDRAVDAALQIALEFDFEEWLGRVPAPGPRRRGPQTQARQRDEVRQRLMFFNVSSFQSWEARYGKLCESTRFRTSKSFASKDSAVLWWLRRGELESDLISTKVWNPGNLQDRLEAIRKLTRLSKPGRFLPKLQELCAEAGVAFVVVKTPPGCHASGASRLVTADRAMILVSFRHRSDDHFWFTVFHEIAHLILHGAETFVDDDDAPLNEVEREANEFASSTIVPPSRHNEFGGIGLDAPSIIRFAKSVGVSPGLIVGQLQHRNIIPHSKLNYLKRYWQRPEIDAAAAA